MSRGVLLWQFLGLHSVMLESSAYTCFQRLHVRMLLSLQPHDLEINSILREGPATLEWVHEAPVENYILILFLDLMLDVQGSFLKISRYILTVPLSVPDMIYLVSQLLD